MGGAQPLAATMNGAAAVIVEVDRTRIERRLATRYLDEATDSVDTALSRAHEWKRDRIARSIAIEGNASEVLPELLRRAGARPLRSTFVFFGGCAGDPLFPAVVENMAGVVESAGDALVAAGAIERADLEQRLERLRAFGRRDDAALWYALCWAEGVRPEGS